MPPNPSLVTAGELFSRGYRRVLTACGMVAGSAIVAIAVLVSIDVAIRNLGVGNFPWLLEVAEYTIYITTFLAAPWVLHLGAHVRVDLVVQALPDAIAKSLELMVSLTGAGISGFLIYHGTLVVTEAHELNAIVVKELAVSEWLLLLIIPVSGALLAFEFVIRGVRALRGDDLSEPSDLGH